MPNIKGKMTNSLFGEFSRVINSLHLRHFKYNEWKYASIEGTNGDVVAFNFDTTISNIVIYVGNHCNCPQITFKEPQLKFWDRRMAKLEKLLKARYKLLKSGYDSDYSEEKILGILARF